MKHINISTYQQLIKTILASTLLFFAVSCDKIEPSEDGTYTVYSGAVGEWEDSEPVADHTHRVWIEKYTGPRCNNCPTADGVIHDILNQASYRDKVVATAIHATAVFGYPIGDSPDLRTDEGEAWCTNFFGNTASFPTVLLNRQKNGSTLNTVNPTSPFTSDIDAIIGEATTVAIAVESHFDSQAGKISITSSIELLDNLDDDITLTVLFIEDSIIATQKMPDGTENAAYVHNHVLRGLVTDKWGFDIDCDKTRGTARKVTLRADLPEGAKQENCQVVAFVSDKSSRTIYNVATCPIL